MNCKNCGAKADEKERYCPGCGDEINPTKDEPRVKETCAKAADSSGSAAAVKRKNSSRAGIAVVAVVLVLAIVGGLIAGGIIDLSGLGGDKGDRVVVVMGDNKLTNRMLAYYYWNEVYYLENSYYSSYGITLDQILEPGVSFADQKYLSEEYDSWHDYFLAMAIENWAFTVAVAEIANNENHVLNVTYVDYLADFENKTIDEAAYYGYSSIDEMFIGDFGEFADMDSYRLFREQRFMASSYSYSIYETAMDMYSAGLEMTDSINVRHILIGIETAETDEDIAAAKARTEEVYALWQQNPTEDNFAALAVEYTDDTSSLYTGGLYEGVAPGEMVTEFDEWCFEEGRKAGDNGIVETQFGFHIMYFSGYGDEQVPADISAAYDAETKAENDYMEWLNNLFDTLDFKVEEGKIEILKTSF